MVRAGLGAVCADSGCLFAGDELEYIRPNVYRNIARQLNISLHSETVVSDAFLAVAAQIFTAGTVPRQTHRQGWVERSRMEPPLSEKACFWNSLQGGACSVKGLWAVWQCALL